MCRVSPFLARDDNKRKQNRRGGACERWRTLTDTSSRLWRCTRLLPSLSLGGSIENCTYGSVVDGAQRTGEKNKHICVRLLRRGRIWRQDGTGGPISLQTRVLGRTAGGGGGVSCGAYDIYLVKFFHGLAVREFDLMSRLGARERRFFVLSLNRGGM